MPRPLVVGNGKMLINFDNRLNMRDLYYPYVGEANHIGGFFSRMGVWVDDTFSWCNSAEWHIKMGYLKDSLVSHVVAWHEELQLELHIHDAVHQRDTIYMKQIKITNKKDTTREVRLFLHQDISINELSVGDTAVYDPSLHVLYHYKKEVYVLTNGSVEENEHQQAEGIYQFSAGVKRFNHAEGTWRDAEDGELSNHPVAQGSVDSVVSFRTVISPHKTNRIHYWLCVGKNYTEVKALNRYVLESSPDALLHRVKVYWQHWANKSNRSYANLPASVIDLYKRSLLTIRTQTDQHGAFLAANDTDILLFNRDHYSYMWPRDGALIAYALILAGYQSMVNPFFRFCADVLTEEGYMLHKYNPDGSIGSSWHPFIHENEIHLPIQEDETALIVFALWKHYETFNNIEYVQPLYASLVRPAARFMLEYMSTDLDLPKPSYDLWEERRGIFTFTASSVYAGLKAAASFAQLFGDEKRYQVYLNGAERVKRGILKHLYCKEKGRFLRGISLSETGEIIKDDTLESSIYGIFEFGVLPATDERVQQTIAMLKKSLRVKTSVGGYARYYNDYYFQRSTDLNNIPGNPWIICSLWYTEHLIETATSLEELKKAVKDLEWVKEHTMETGILPEQLDPHSGDPLSVAPLTWSHSTYVLTVNKYIAKYHALLQEAPRHKKERKEVLGLKT
jgi:GH15 family glucan-1,4-alpha-glucosidase